MKLRLKNRTLLAMDKLIKEAIAKNGIPDYFIFEPNEAASFLKEVKSDKKTFKKHVEIKQVNGIDVDVRFLMQSDLTQDTLYMLINRWFKKEFNIFYQGIEIKITKKKVLDAHDVPTPQGPLGADHVLTHDDPANDWAPPIEFPAKGLLPPPPEPPVGPPSRLINDHTLGRCKQCGSSVHYKWGFFGMDGCIQPECENYYKK